jgi:hypothetical protein
VQRLGEHRLDECVADRARRARAGLIAQTPEPERCEAATPLADSLRGDSQQPRNLAI